MIGDNNAVGHADYGMQAGPGIVRARMAGSVTVPSNLFYPFNPSVQAVSTTELTVRRPGRRDQHLGERPHRRLPRHSRLRLRPILRRHRGRDVGRAVRSPGGAQLVRRLTGQHPRACLRSGPGRIPRARRRHRDSVRRTDEHSDPDHDGPQPERPVRRQPGPVDVRRGFRRPRREAPGELRPGEAGAERRPGRLHRVGAERRRQPLDGSLRAALGRRRRHELRAARTAHGRPRQSDHPQPRRLPDDLAAEPHTRRRRPDHRGRRRGGDRHRLHRASGAT